MSTPARRQLKCAKGTGHTDSVNCLAVHPTLNIVASGSEDGSLCVWDVRTQRLAQRLLPADLQSAQAEPIAALTISSAVEWQLWAAAGARALCLDLRRLGGGGGEGAASGEAGGAPALLHATTVGSEEINCLALDAAGLHLAAANDEGEVRLLELQADSSLRRPKPLKVLRRGHDNVGACCAFRPGTRWELLSGGFDSRIVHWGERRC